MLRLIFLKSEIFNFRGLLVIGGGWVSFYSFIIEDLI